SPKVRDQLRPAMTGWQAHTRPFDFEDTMEYTTGAFRWLNGTPVIPALYVAAEGAKILRKAGIAAIREKSVRLTSHLVERADELGYKVFAPRDPSQRGGTVALDVPHGYEVTQFLLSRDILVDYRVGAGIRIAPHFFTREEEVDEAISSITTAIETGAWEKFAERASVVT
ncbi:MAG: aminotransferase class V-fold PLP-dependent enzyme, partial [Gemmatimonadota bacterium]|nr:aminotransferase class V-fold PLP-dependent enzyme [Gemmatimonadota bacterium]